ncbi:MAG: hypothetical protein FK734_06190 [Asgard group archaeon]|nr:hypothetical protein [Asgard group archaeon]
MSDNNDLFPVEDLMNYFFMLTEEHLKTKYPEYEAKEIISEFKQIFRELIVQYSSDPIKQNDAINPIFLIALHDSQPNLSREELLEQMLSVYRKLLEDILLSQNIGLATSDNPWKTFVKATKDANKQLYENEFFQCQTVVENEQEFGFNINRCIYYEIFVENNHKELAPLLCEYDYILADNLREWLIFNRDETIANGFEKCTFRYYLKKS